MNDIRSKMESNPELQQAADRLLSELAPIFPSGKGEEILSAILDKATKGANFPDQYPQFKQILNSDPALKAAFQELIELLESEASVLEGYAAPQKSALDFLNQTKQTSKVETNPPGGWRVELRQTLENLRNIFTPLSLVYRDPLAAFDNRWFSLLREEVTFDYSILEVVLDATISEKKEESLDLLLQVVTVQIPKDHTLPEQLSGTLTWGSYQHTAVLNLDQQTIFPPADFSMILDASLENVSADLSLVIQASG